MSLRRIVLGLVPLTALAVACGSADVDVEPRRVGVDDELRPYLLAPLSGFELTVGAEEELRLDQGHRNLLEATDVDGASLIARQILSRDPGSAPADVLAAQVSMVEEDLSAVIDRLRPVVERYPSYDAARVLLARALERRGQAVAAYDAYHAAADVDVAASRLEALEDEVRSELALRLEESLAALDLDHVEELASRLEEWFPGSLEHLEGAVRLAQARGEEEAELTALRDLSDARPLRRTELRRLASLEVDVGDPTQGVEILEDLLALHGGDLELREELETAKFTWRLEMLPPEVAELVEAGRLTRAQLASLLYWVLPGVRAGGPVSGTITTDVPLDHPHRREVVRVVNRGLMPLADPARRRFAPEQTVDLRLLLDTLLRAPETLGVRSACTQDFLELSRPSFGQICAAAVRCGIVPSKEECSSNRVANGAEVREMMRRTLNLLGGSGPSRRR